MSGRMGCLGGNTHWKSVMICLRNSAHSTEWPTYMNINETHVTDSSPSDVCPVFNIPMKTVYWLYS